MNLPADGIEFMPKDQVLKHDVVPEKLEREQAIYDLDQEIAIFAEELATRDAQQMVNEDALLTFDVIKERLKLQYIEKFSAKEMSKSIAEAVALLGREGPRYIDHEKWELLVQEFMRASILLQPKKGEDVPEVTFQKLGQISDASMQAIEKCAQQKYIEQEYEASALLFTLLAALDETQFVYWQSIGISYHELGAYAKAIQAYEQAWQCDSESISNRLFLAEIYLSLNDKMKAREVCQQAEELIQAQEAIDRWDKHFSFLKRAIDEDILIK